jgi:hypothetical protein
MKSENTEMSKENAPSLEKAFQILLTEVLKNGTCSPM